MPILIDGPQGRIAADSLAFDNEGELEKVVASQPNLLETDDEEPLALVNSQVTLPEAGSLDLLFVSEAGLPVAVEVKLARNGESRREVVAQVVDYVSALTSLTVDELNQRVGGSLEIALRSFDAGSDIDEFDRPWQAVGANLRAGLARVVLVLDDVRPDLERIVRFLSDHSNLDVRLVTISKYAAQKVGILYVPRIIITAQGKPAPRPTSGPRPLRPELAQVIQAYDQMAASELQTRGNASWYRQIRPPEWPAGFRVHYEFVYLHKGIGAELHLENDRATSLTPLLSQMAGRKVGPTQSELQWDPKWSRGKGRLMVRYPRTEPPDTIAKSMLDLIQLTREPVARQVSELGITAPVNVLEDGTSLGDHSP
jgi:hypothetical protein